MDRFFDFLSNLSRELTPEEWNNFSQRYKIPPLKREKFQQAIDFFKWMNEMGLLDPLNFKELKNCFAKIQRTDLIKKVEEFEGKTIKYIDIIPSSQILKEPRPIGKGAYGTVYKADYNGTPVAAKELLADISKDAEKDFIKESNILR
jgi:hypothetical protein